MSHPIRIVKAGDIKTSGGQTEGMIRQDAIVDVCDNMCSLGKSPLIASYLECSGKADVRRQS